MSTSAGGNDLLVADVEAVGEGQGLAGAQVGSDILFIHSSLLLIVDQNHDDVGLLRCLCSRIHLKSLRFCFRPGFASLIKANDNIIAGILQIQRMCVSLAAITDDGYFFAFQ